MASQDLSQIIFKSLDRHMVFPVLQFIEDKQLYNRKDLAQAKLDLINKTKMVDEAIDQHKALYGTDPPKEMVELRSATHSAIKQSTKKLKPLLDAIAKQMEEPSATFTLDTLKSDHGVTDENLEDLYAHAKLNFDCGAYQKAADYLQYYRELSSDGDKKFLALWGQLGGEILTVHDNEVNEERALADLKELHKLITERGDAGKLDHLEQLQQRTWLIHWGLFLFSQLEEQGQVLLLDFLFQDKVMNAVQTTSPHMLRYLTAAAIISRRKKVVNSKNNEDNQAKLEKVVNILVQEREGYADSVTEFLYNMHHEFDFEAAQHRLEECSNLLLNDFFLANVRELFMEEARMLMFETYYRIHRRIDVSELGKRLGLEQDEHLTPTIMRYIKEARVDAKIDANQNQIVMSAAPLSIYQQVIEGTKDLHYRSNDIFARIAASHPSRD